jgi:hypothetical protein
MAESTEKTTPGPWLSGKTYDFLKFVAQILLPALGTLYAALAATWTLPASEQVVGTVLAVDTFLGVVLGISTAQYRASNALVAATGENDGTMTIHRYDDDHGMFELNFPDHPTELMKKDRVVLKVETRQSEPPSEHAHQYTDPGNLPPVQPPS